MSDDPIPAEARAANLQLWNAWAKIHEHAPGYNTAGFLAGETALTPVELEELGPFVHEGTTLLHLQCHFGLDTLTWARAGAVVTGADFSGAAIAQARALAAEVGLSARATFVQSDVTSLADVLGGRFDVVFTSWGVLIWLQDLEPWADVVTHFLKPGGTFYLAEFHPNVLTLAEDSTPDRLRVGYPYFQHGEPLRFDEPGTYADPGARTRNNVTYEWVHGFAETIGLIRAVAYRVPD